MVRGVIAASTAAGSSAKSSSNRVGDVAHDAAGEDDRRDVGDVRRLVEDDLVARVARGAQRQVDGLRGADRDQDLGGRVVADAVAALEVGRRAPGAARASRSWTCSGSGPRAATLDARLDDRRAGVSKSGSPTPRLMTSSIVARMSKNRRMPDGGHRRGRAAARARLASGDGPARRPVEAVARTSVVAGRRSAARSVGSRRRQSASAVMRLVAAREREQVAPRTTARR